MNAICIYFIYIFHIYYIYEIHLYYIILYIILKVLFVNYMKKAGKHLARGTIIIESFPKTVSPLLLHNFFKGIFIQEILAKEHKIALSLSS